MSDWMVWSLTILAFTVLPVACVVVIGWAAYAQHWWLLGGGIVALLLLIVLAVAFSHFMYVMSRH